MSANPKQTVKNKKLVMEMMKNIAESSLTTINDNLSNTYHSDVEWRGFYPLEDLKGLEALELKERSKFIIVGQEYEMAKYIYKNNISEVNSILNKK